MVQSEVVGEREREREREGRGEKNLKKGWLGGGMV